MGQLLLRNFLGGIKINTNELSDACFYFKLNEPEPEVPSAFCTSIQSALSAGKVAGAFACACELEPCEWVLVFIDPTPEASPTTNNLFKLFAPIKWTFGESCVDPSTMISAVLCLPSKQRVIVKETSLAVV